MKLILVLFIIFLFGCDEDKNEQKYLDFYSKEFISLENIEQIDSREKVIQSSSNLLTFRESLFINLSGKILTTEEKSSISLFVYSSDDRLNGSFIVLSANKNQPGSLNVELFTLENQALSLCSIPYALSENGFFEIDIQFDNSVQGGRITIWNKYKSPHNKGYKSTPRIYSLNTSSCTSQNQTVINSFGSGTSWGIILEGAKIYFFKRGVPYAL